MTIFMASQGYWHDDDSGPGYYEWTLVEDFYFTNKEDADTWVAEVNARAGAPRLAALARAEVDAELRYQTALTKWTTDHRRWLILRDAGEVESEPKEPVRSNFRAVRVPEDHPTIYDVEEISAWKPKEVAAEPDMAAPSRATLETTEKGGR